MRLENKVAIVMGAGQTPGDTLGNGRATALLFAREGAHVIAVDRKAASAAETAAMIQSEGGRADAVTADACDETAVATLVKETLERAGRIDILHNNVGIGGGDADPLHIDTSDWDRILGVNLKSAVVPCKYVIPIMRQQGGGSIVNVSSIAAVCSTPTVAYKSSKAALNAYTQTLAVRYAPDGVRANVIMPGLIETPMAIEGISGALRMPKQDLIERRNAQVPLRAHMGTAWDVAYAALFLASDEAKFISGAVLPIDGAQSARIG